MPRPAAGPAPAPPPADKAATTAAPAPAAPAAPTAAAPRGCQLGPSGDVRQPAPAVDLPADGAAWLGRGPEAAHAAHAPSTAGPGSQPVVAPAAQA
eukprot:9485438-Alexandrium_andersonii.AAC.1